MDAASSSVADILPVAAAGNLRRSLRARQLKSTGSACSRTSCLNISSSTSRGAARGGDQTLEFADEHQMRKQAVQ